MSVFGMSIEKETTFRGVTERFSNVYHYNVASWDANSWQSMVDVVVNAEKAIFAANTTFKLARIFGPVGEGEAANIMQYITDLTGAGSATSGTAYPELAAVVAWPLARSVTTGRKRFLRKYLHLGSTGISTGQNPLIASATVTALQNYAAAVDDVSWGVYSGYLCAPQGDAPLAAAYVLPAAHIRQFRR
jgi:hypothetical protein